jgi:hypothetical protein
MNYGKLNVTYCITATYGEIVIFKYYESEAKAKRAEKKLIKEGFKTFLK